MLFILFIINVLLQVADLATSLYAFNKANAIEKNPLLAPLMRKYGNLKVLFISKLFAIAMLYILFSLNLLLLLLVLAVGMGIVVINNIRTINE